MRNVAVERDTAGVSEAVDRDPFHEPRGVMHRIKADILLGEFRPGEWMRLVDVAERYAASRFEVRSAFAGLAVIELLEHVANRGYRVAVVTDDEAAQWTEVRILLEVPATELVLQRATRTDHAVLRELANRFAACVEHGTTAEIEVLNHRFHRAFFALCGNPRLERLINETRERPWPRGWVHWKTVAGNRASAADHLAMVDALRDGDAAGLRTVALRHLRRTGSAPRAGFARPVGLPPPVRPGNAR